MISSLFNPRVKEARSLQRRRNRQSSGRCLLEGLRLIEDAWQSGVLPDPLFYVPEVAAQQPGLLGLVRKLTAAGVTCLACTPTVLAAMAETLAPQGLVAVVPLPALPIPPLLSLALVLDGVRDPGNLGTLLRTAEAAGVELVLLAPGTVDAFNGKVLRAAMGAHFRLPIRSCAEWDEVRRYLVPLPQIYVAQAAAATAYDQVDWRQPAALIVGSESEGPGPEARELGSGVAIPMQGATESLNAAVAGAVILFEAARQRRSR